MSSREWTPSHVPTGRVGIYIDRAEVELRPYTGEILPLLDEDLVFFKARFELDKFAVAQHIKRSGDGRYVLPIHTPPNPYAGDRGYVLRVPWDGAPLRPSRSFPKADTYRSALGPVQSHYNGSGGVGPEYNKKPLVIVEDQLSAIKLAGNGYHSVALLGAPTDKLGTYGGQDRVAEIARRVSKSRINDVIVALDSDATEEAFKFARKWGHAFNKLRVAILERDLKDTKAWDFAEILGV